MINLIIKMFFFKFYHNNNNSIDEKFFVNNNNINIKLKLIIKGKFKSFQREKSFENKIH